MKKIKIFWLISWFSICILFAQWDERFYLERALEPPSFTHPFGCDPFGRDLFFLQFKAFFQSSSIAFLSTLIVVIFSFFLGTFLALSSHKFRTITEKLIFYCLCFPSLVIALILTSLYGPNWNTLLFALFFGMIPFAIQMVYYRTLELLKEDFYLSAHALGATQFNLIHKHIFPYVFPFLILKIPYFFSRAMLAEASLSFLGIGAPLGETTLGTLFSLSRDYLIIAPWMIFFISLPFIFTIYSFMTLSQTSKVTL